MKDEVTVKSIGSFYSGKNVHSPKHQVHLYVVAFFLRRGLFVIATVYLFDYPQMQMVVHHVLTMTFTSYLAFNNSMYASRD